MVLGRAELKSSPSRLRASNSTVPCLPRINRPTSLTTKPQPTRTAKTSATAKRAKPTNAHSLPVLYRYWVLPGNNSGLIRQALRRRPWWGKAVTKDGDPKAEPEQYNLRWRSITGKIDYAGLNKDPRVKQMVNHLPRHNCLVTKSGLCKNMVAFYESRGARPHGCRM